MFVNLIIDKKSKIIQELNEEMGVSLGIKEQI